MFDEVDKRLSQGTSSLPRPSQGLSLNQRRKRSSDIAFALDLSKKGPGDDKENIGDDEFDCKRIYVGCKHLLGPNFLQRHRLRR